MGIDLVTQLPLFSPGDQFTKIVGNSELRNILDYPFFNSVMVVCIRLGMGKVQ